MNVAASWTSMTADSCRARLVTCGTQDCTPGDDREIVLSMQNIKEEPVDAENDLELESGKDEEFRIVSVDTAREANDWGDHGDRSLLHVWSDDKISHPLKEADENIADGDETQAITLRSKRMGCPYDHHVPSKKVIPEHITSAPVELSLGKQANGEEVREAQNLIDQHGVFLRDQSDHRRYNPQQQTRFQGDIIFNRSSKHGRTSSGKFRKVCKDITCLPAEYPEDNCTYRVPRGKEREQLAMLGLVGKILIQSSWNFENFRAEVITLFRKYFSCSEEEFSFNFLQCLPGNRKLIKPNVSATFKWSGIAIISLAAQGSVYIKTPHALAAPTKNLFFTTKQCLPRTESENVNENIPSDRTIPEIIRSGDTRLLNNVYQMDEEDSQHYPIKDLKVLQQQELGSDPSAETSSDTGNTDTKYDTEEKSFNMTNNMVFTMLRDAGIKTAHVKKVSEKRFVTCGCEIIPIVWGCWRIATGIYLKRHPATEGRRLYPPRVEIFYKQNDACEDVVCSKEHILASKMNCAGLSIGQSEIDIMNHSTVAMFEILEKACLAADFILLNMKVQFGVNFQSKEIVLADVIKYNCRHQTPLEDQSEKDDKPHLPSCKGEGRVVVVMKSLSYLEHCEKIKASCAKYCIPCELRVSSAYTGPGETLDIRSQYEGDGTLTVFITVAGRSNGLASLLSANTAYPVINCPAVTADWSAQDFRSALNTPENLGFCTVMSPEAAAQFSAHILGLSNHQLWSKLRSSTLNKWICMKQADEKLKDCSM